MTMQPRATAGAVTLLALGALLLATPPDGLPGDATDGRTWAAGAGQGLTGQGPSGAGPPHPGPSSQGPSSQGPSAPGPSTLGPSA